MNCQKMDLFQGPNGLKQVKFDCFATFCQFSQKLSDNFCLFLACSFLGMILINCQEMDFIELFKRLFLRSERSGFCPFPLNY